LYTARNLRLFPGVGVPSVGEIVRHGFRPCWPLQKPAKCAQIDPFGSTTQIKVNANVRFL
jgi:hypothetical protein